MRRASKMEEEFLNRFMGKNVYIWTVGTDENFEGKLEEISDGVAALDATLYIECEMIVAIQEVQ